MSGDAGPPDRGDAVRAELVTVEGDWARAVASNDAGRIAEFMADDWVIVSDHFSPLVSKKIARIA